MAKSKTNVQFEMDKQKHITNSINDMNLEILQFKRKLSSFQKNCMWTTLNLRCNFTELVKEVEQLVNPPDLGSVIWPLAEKNCNLNLEQEFIERTYVCRVCNLEIGYRHREIKSHVENRLHKTRVNNIRQQQEIQEDANIQNLVKPQPSARARKAENVKARKQARKEKKDKKAKKNEIINLPKKTRTFLESNPKGFFMKSVSVGLKVIQIPDYDEIEKDLLSILQPTYPDVKVYFFGSRMNGLGNIDSDLDIFVNIGEVFNTYDEDHAIILQKLETVNKLLAEHPRNWAKIVAVKAAKVPILKTYNKNYRIDCDISFSNGLGKRNTMLIKYYLELQPICHKMCLFIKKWLSTLSLHNCSSYSFVLLVIFYMQTLNYLPSVASLQEGIEPCEEIGPWQVNFAEKSLATLKMTQVEDTTENCMEFMKNCFKFYKDFDYSSCIICPYYGKVIKKAVAACPPELFPRYRKYCEEMNWKCPLNTQNICVQDVFVHNRNVTSGITDKMATLIKKYLNLTHEALQSPTSTQENSVLTTCS